MKASSAQISSGAKGEAAAAHACAITRPIIWQMSTFDAALRIAAGHTLMKNATSSTSASTVY